MDLISRESAIESVKNHCGDENAIIASIVLLPTQPIDYEVCSNALLMMWMEYVISDVEFNRIMNKLNKAHEDGRL